MVDLAGGVESMNYGLKRGMDLRTLVESLKVIWPLAAVACALSFHIWVRAQTVQVGYQTQQLRRQVEKLRDQERQIALEAQTHGNLEMVNLIARSDPGVIILRADPIQPPQPPSRELGSSEKFEVGSLVQKSGPQELSTLN